MSSSARPRMTGIGRVLVIVYAIMALAATGRSFVQIVERFHEAPLAYTLSALSAVVYILATLALIFSGSRGWYRVAWITILFELVVVVRPGLHLRSACAAVLRAVVPHHAPPCGACRDDGCRDHPGRAVIVFRDPAEVPEGFGPSVVAIGKFDGVHAGHRAVLERARVDAAIGDARVVAVTFDRNPLSVLRPELCPEDLIGVTQKVQLLAETGIDAALVLRFDEQLASLPARDFVERILVDALGARTVMVGLDFRFGKGGTGNPDVLRELGEELGFRVDVIEDVRSLDSDRRVSSTWIRELLAAGDVEDAAKLLGRPHAVWGE